MKLSRGLVVVFIWLTCVSASRPCPENCKNSTLGTCNIDTGACSRGCVPGYYGNTCNMTCDDNCKQETCQWKDGSCTCKPGYTFNSGSCDPNTGAECRSNDHCKNNKCVSAGRRNCLEGCKPGWFGEFCQQNCSFHCACDRVSGICTSCIPGWYGEKCGSLCKPGCVDKKCDKVSGICTSCIRGWYGEECGSLCSPGCVDENCHRNGTCVGGCRKGSYGEMCESSCPEHCDDGQCDTYGACTSCRSGFYGTLCRQKCHRCTDQVCEMMTGECMDGCKSGFYSSFCNLTCEHCEEGNCVQDTGECTLKNEKGEKWSAVQSWVGGGVAIVIIIPVALGVFYMFRRLKRMNGVVYDIVKWRRRPTSAVDVTPVVAPGYVELDEEASTNPPRVCPIRPISQASYIEPQHSGGSGNNLQIQRQLHTVGVSDQQEDEHRAAAVSPSHNVQRRSESHDRPDSYVLPNYCEVNEELMAALPQPPPGAEAPAPVVENSSFSVVADVHVHHEHSDDGNADLTIPLIAECYGPTETEDSPPDEEPRPNVENYEHPFKNHYTKF